MLLDYIIGDKKRHYIGLLQLPPVYEKRNVQMNLKLKHIQNSTRAEYCYHSCFLLTIQCMHISCRQGLGEERIQMRYAIVRLSESA